MSVNVLVLIYVFLVKTKKEKVCTASVNWYKISKPQSKLEIRAAQDSYKTAIGNERKRLPNISATCCFQDRWFKLISKVDIII